MVPTPIADAFVTREELDERQPRFPLDLYFCRDCFHLQLLDVPDPALMFRHNYTYQSGSSAGIVRHFRDYAARLLKRENPPQGSLVVDVGSNDGTFLQPMKQAGMDVLGIDASGGMAEVATKAGIETFPAFLDVELARRVRDERGPAQIVTANNVLAHADDLGSMADSIRIMLRRDGLFAFEVSYAVDVIEKMLVGTIFHEHLSYHTVKPLRAFLARRGLELVDLEHNTIQGGSIIGFAQPVGGPRPVSAHVAEAVRAEEDRGFDRPDAFRAFSSRLDHMQTSVSQLLEKATSDGAVVAGFGAARGGTTLLYRLSIGDRMSFIVDDSPAKQNLYTPGHHIPVLPSESLYERKPDYVFILAWVHARAIVAKHQRYLEEGGRFIVAYPRVALVSADGDQGLLG